MIETEQLFGGMTWAMVLEDKMWDIHMVSVKALKKMSPRSGLPQT